jgi:hypothetical protein
VQTDGADRVEDPLDAWSGLRASGSDPGDDGLESALLAYAQRKAARWGAERFAAEFRRRDEMEETRPVWTSDALAAPVEASVEEQVVDGEPATFRPEPPRIGFDVMLVPAPPEPTIADVTPEGELPSTPEPAVLGELADEPPPVELAVEPPPAELAVDLPPVELAVEQPRFEPDAAWSAASGAAGKRVRMPLRHPHVPRPPAPDAMPTIERRRGRRPKRGQPEPVRTPAISAPEWARMSPGARRLYGFEEPPGSRRAG